MISFKIPIKSILLYHKQEFIVSGIAITAIFAAFLFFVYKIHKSNKKTKFQTELLMTQVLPTLAWLLGGLGRSMAAQIVAALLFTVAAAAMCRLYLQLYLKQADGYFHDWKSRFSSKKLLWAAGYIALMLAINPLYEILMAALGVESSVDNLQNQHIIMEMLQRSLDRKSVV